MPSQIPKPAALRQRRNLPKSGATLIDAPSRRRVPPLPQREEAWHSMTEAWWRDVWRSPMAAEYLQADVHGLYRLAVLIDRFWLTGSETLAGEIRLEQQSYGITPLDRRRLEWQVEKVEAVARKRPAPPKPVEPADDPRALLSVV